MQIVHQKWFAYNASKRRNKWEKRQLHRLNNSSYRNIPKNANQIATTFSDEKKRKLNKQAVEWPLVSRRVAGEKQSGWKRTKRERERGKERRRRAKRQRWIQSTSYKMMDKNDICANVLSDCVLTAGGAFGDWPASSWMSWKIIAQNVMSTVMHHVCTAKYMHGERVRIYSYTWNVCALRVQHNQQHKCTNVSTSWIGNIRIEIYFAYSWFLSNLNSVIILRI